MRCKYVHIIEKQGLPSAPRGFIRNRVKRPGELVAVSVRKRRYATVPLEWEGCAANEHKPEDLLGGSSYSRTSSCGECAPEWDEMVFPCHFI